VNVAMGWSVIASPKAPSNAHLSPGSDAENQHALLALAVRCRGSGPRPWLLPIMVAGQVGWTVYLGRVYRGFLLWLVPATAVLAGAAILIMVLDRVAVQAIRTGSRSNM
jgi:hypothetical protein